MIRSLSISILICALALLAGCGRGQSPAPGAIPAQTPAARGEHLSLVLGCNDCHTPKIMGAQGPEPDMSRRLIGHPEGPDLPAPPGVSAGPWMVSTTMDLTAWSGPWGVSYAINLTPDQDTGIGIWTEEMFIKAIRTGKHMGEASSRPILPPMPWQDFNYLRDDELKDLFAYLKSLPPTKNHVPDPVILPPSDAAAPAPGTTGATGPARPSGA